MGTFIPLFSTHFFPADDTPLDLLLLDEIGKEISGAGMDTNVIGRKPGSTQPHIKRIAVRRLSRGTQGNGLGIGHADFTTEKLLQQIDLPKTRLNCLVSLNPESGRLPFAYPSDHEMIQAALESIGLTPPPQARMLWIQNTLNLEEMECSASLLPEARKLPQLEILTNPRSLRFDAFQNLEESFHVDS